MHAKRNHQGDSTIKRNPWDVPNVSYRTHREQVCLVSRHAARADVGFDSVWPMSDDAKKYPYDPPISEIGMKEACALGRKIRAAISGCSAPPVVVSSPYQRCVQTACEVCSILKAPLMIDLTLGEIYGKEVFGEVEPKVAYRPFSTARKYAKACGVAISSKCIGQQPIWPETTNEARKRFAKRFQKYVKFGLVGQKNFLIIAHADAVATALSCLPDAPEYIESIDPCGFFIMQRELSGTPTKDGNKDELGSPKQWKIQYDKICTGSPMSREKKVLTGDTLEKALRNLPDESLETRSPDTPSGVRLRRKSYPGIFDPGKPGMDPFWSSTPPAKTPTTPGVVEARGPDTPSGVRLRRPSCSVSFDSGIPSKPPTPSAKTPTSQGPDTPSEVRLRRPSCPGSLDSVSTPTFPDGLHLTSPSSRDVPSPTFPSMSYLDVESPTTPHLFQNIRQHREARVSGYGPFHEDPMPGKRETVPPTRDHSCIGACDTEVPIPQLGKMQSLPDFKKLQNVQLSLGNSSLLKRRGSKDLEALLGSRHPSKESLQSTDCPSYPSESSQSPDDVILLSDVSQRSSEVNHTMDPFFRKSKSLSDMQGTASLGLRMSKSRDGLYVADAEDEKGYWYPGGMNTELPHSNSLEEMLTELDHDESEDVPLQLGFAESEDFWKESEGILASPFEEDSPWMGS